MDDLISKQAAIDALGERPLIWSDDDKYAIGKQNQYDSDRLALEAVPSTIVRCRDCKHWEYDVIFQDGWCRGKHQGNPDWFCADGERRNDNGSD